jgi:hypothetical protein
VWTQTTDVEGEVNGLMTYDRKVIRMNETQWKADVQALYDAAEKKAVNGSSWAIVGQRQMGQIGL